MKVTIATCVVLFLFVSFSYAQTPDYKTEVFGLVGLAGVHDDESYLGSGLNFGGGLGLRLSKRFGLNFEGYYADTSRDFSSGVRFESDATTFAADFHVYFPMGKVEPYVLVGSGLTHFSQTNLFAPGENFHSEENGYTLQFGGGTRIFVTPQLSVRPEFKWVTSKFSFINQLRGTISIGYHW